MAGRVEDGWSKQDEPSSRWAVARLLLVAVGLAAAAALLLVVRSLPAELLPANTDYTLTIAPGVRTITAPARVAALARGYLDAQTPQLAAPEIHSPPRILSLVAVPAREARAVEPRIPAGPIATAPGRARAGRAVSSPGRPRTLVRRSRGRT